MRKADRRPVQGVADPRPESGPAGRGRHSRGNEGRAKAASVAPATGAVLLQDAGSADRSVDQLQRPGPEGWIQAGCEVKQRSTRPSAKLSRRVVESSCRRVMPKA